LAVWASRTRRLKSLKSLTNEFMELKLAPKVFDQLSASLAKSSIRRRPGAHGDGAVRARRRNAAQGLIASFPKNETNLHWVDK
jgi:hypothetical protein